MPAAANPSRGSALMEDRRFFATDPVNPWPTATLACSSRGASTPAAKRHSSRSASTSCRKSAHPAHGTSFEIFEEISAIVSDTPRLVPIAWAIGTSLGVSDTMALISSKISKLVPWAGCALFLHDVEADLLECRFAAGVDAPRLLHARVAVGHGLTGSVAKNRRSSINADPRLGFAAAGISEPTVLNSALVCPLYFED